MRKLLLLIPVLLLCSWGFKGHRTVASIADNHLNPDIRKVALSYLGTESFSDASTWADEHKTSENSPWHYINLPLGLSHDEFIKVVKESKNNVYTAILQTEAILKDGNSSNEKKNEALKYLIHFIGDAHQPFHVSRKEDKGGNDIQVRFEGKGTNLHSLWDSGLIDFEGLNETQMTNSYDTATPTEIKKWQSDDPAEWLWESYQISSEVYAGVKSGQKIDKAYYDKYIPVIHQRVNMAGIRLAGELNKILVSKQPIVLKEIPVEEITLKDVPNKIGKTVTVTGKVYGIKDVKSMILVNVGAAFPNQLLTVVLKDETKGLANKIDGKEITVTGELIEYKGKPEIILKKNSMIKIK